MSVWLGLGMIIGVLVIVAVALLISDIARGDVGGGRHTMERAERLLVVADDPGLLAGADPWIAEQREKYPDKRILVLEEVTAEDVPSAVHYAIEREKPDAIVVARSFRDDPASLGGLYGELKESAGVPVDAIYVKAGAPA